MRSRPVLIATAALLGACAPRAELRATVVETEFLQPLVDEAAHVAARCIRAEPSRMIEISVTPSGAVEALVLPWPAPPQTQACAESAAAGLHLQPAPQWTRSFMRGDGRVGDPTGARERGLSLRARATQQHDAIERCRQGQMARHPGEASRIGVFVEVDRDGAVHKAEIPAASPNADVATRACVADAVSALKLPPIAGAYRYSYLFDPRGLLVGAPDADPVDQLDLEVAVAAIARARDACFGQYQLAGQILVHFSVGNDGVPLAVRIERPASATEDRAADACLRRAFGSLRLPPFDGAPPSLTLPYKLQ